MASLPRRAVGLGLLAVSLLYLNAPVRADGIDVDVTSSSVSVKVMASSSLDSPIFSNSVSVRVRTNSALDTPIFSGQMSVVFDPHPLVSDPVSVEMERVLRGDVDGNGVTNAGDLGALIQIYLGFQPVTLRKLAAADVRPRRVDPVRPYGDRLLLGDDINWAFRHLFGLENTP